MLRSLMLLALAALLLASAGAAIWVGYSMRQSTLQNALPAQTRGLESLARHLGFRVDQLQKPLQSLAAGLAQHPATSTGALQAELQQPTSIAALFEQLQLADESGQLLLNMRHGHSQPLAQLSESVRDFLKRGLTEGKPVMHVELRLGHEGLQLEFHHAVPVRTAQARWRGVLGGSQRLAASSVLPLEDETLQSAGRLYLFGPNGRLLAREQQGQWELMSAEQPHADLGEADIYWVKAQQRAPANTVAEQRGTQLWSAVALPGLQWTLVKVSQQQDWVPGMGRQAIALLVGGLMLLGLGLLVVMALIAHPLTALFRKAERAGQRGVLECVDAQNFGALWWQRLSTHDWGEAQALRQALQALGGSREQHGLCEQQLQKQLQTLMDCAPVGLMVTRAEKVLRAGMQAARVLGYQPRELEEMSLRQLCLSDQHHEELLRSIVQSLDVYGQFDSEVSLMRKDKTVVWVRLHSQSMQRLSRAWELGPREEPGDYRVWVLEDATLQRMVREQSGWKLRHDPLTRLPNREAFAVRLKEWLQECAFTQPSSAEPSAGGTVAAVMAPSPGPVAEPAADGVMLYVDLDHFSQVNRQVGRAVGDEVLKHMARLIEACVRPQGWVARVGGDKFAVLMPGVSREQGMRDAQLLCMAIQDWEGSHQGQRHMLSASIGMLVLDAKLHTVTSALQGVDMACYAAKRKGRNRVEVFAAAA